MLKTKGSVRTELTISPPRVDVDQAESRKRPAIDPTTSVITDWKEWKNILI